MDHVRHVKMGVVHGIDHLLSHISCYSRYISRGVSGIDRLFRVRVDKKKVEIQCKFDASCPSVRLKDPNFCPYNTMHMQRRKRLKACTLNGIVRYTTCFGILD